MMQSRHPWGAWDFWLGGLTVVRKKQLLLPVCPAACEQNHSSTQRRFSTGSLRLGCSPGTCHVVTSASVASSKHGNCAATSALSLRSLRPWEQALSHSWADWKVALGTRPAWNGLFLLSCKKTHVLWQHPFSIKWKFIFMQNVGCYSQNKRNPYEAVSKGKDLSKEAQYERNCNFSCHWYTLLNWW